MILSFHSPKVFRGLQKRANVVLLVLVLCVFFSPFEKSLRCLGNFSLISQNVWERGKRFLFSSSAKQQKGWAKNMSNTLSSSPRN